MRGPALCGGSGVLWFCVLKSGVHATLAGVILALTIPLRSATVDRTAPLLPASNMPSIWVTFLVIPLFGFANAGVSFAGMTGESAGDPVTLGVALGLSSESRSGCSPSPMRIRLRLEAMPAGAGWIQLYGVALLCGIGFTMSLFIGLLAFADPEKQAVLKLAVLVGSLLSALAGALILLTTAPAKSKRAS